MKKMSTATAKKEEKNASQKVTIGLNLGDRVSWYGVLQGAGASGCDGGPGGSGCGTSADVVDQYGEGTDKVLRRAAAGLESAEHEPGEGAGVESRTENGTGTAAGRDRVAERTDWGI